MVPLTDNTKSLRGLSVEDLIKTNELLFILAQVLSFECKKRIIVLRLSLLTFDSSEAPFQVILGVTS